MLNRLVPLLLVLFCFASQAHDVFSGEAKVVISSEQKITLELNIAAVSAEVFTQNIVGRNNQISPGNLPNIKPYLVDQAKRFFYLTLDSKPLQASEVDIKIITEEDAVVFTLRYDTAINGTLGIRSDFIEQTNPEYKLTVLVLNEYQTQLGLFIHSFEHRYDQILVDATKLVKPNEEGVFLSFLKLGFEHILMGYDHLLFLLALLIVCRNWKDAAIIVTCFTLAHSITLSLASLQIVVVPTQWIELAIAITIVYVGLENLYFKHQPKHRWLLTSSFGLIHGLGFANVLLGLGLGSSGAPVLIPLLAFNLGVEIGQLGLAAVILPILWYLHKYKWYQQNLLPTISVSIVFCGLFWVIQRLS